MPEHGEARRGDLRGAGSDLDLDDRAMWVGLSMPMSEFLLLERALCSCEGRCECDDEWLDG